MAFLHFALEYANFEPILGEHWLNSNLTLFSHLHQTLQGMPVATLRTHNHESHFHLSQMLLQMILPILLTAGERRDLSRAYLSHHELESEFVIMTVVITIIVIVIMVSIIITIITDCSGVVLAAFPRRWRPMEGMARTPGPEAYRLKPDLDPQFNSSSITSPRISFPIAPKDQSEKVSVFSLVQVFSQVFIQVFN